MGPEPGGSTARTTDLSTWSWRPEDSVRFRMQATTTVVIVGHEPGLAGRNMRWLILEGIGAHGRF